jgi:hypothetical protein
MRHVAQVAVIFPQDLGKSDTFDLWELTLVFQSGGPRQAITRALSMARNLLDNTNNRSALGYSGKPVLYAVKSIHADIDFLQRANGVITVLTKGPTLTQAEVDKLRSYQDVHTVYRVVHIEAE